MFNAVQHAKRALIRYGGGFDFVINLWRIVILIPHSITAVMSIVQSLRTVIISYCSYNVTDRQTDRHLVRV